MPYVLGIDIGAGTTKAAVCRRAGGSEPGGTGWGPAQPVSLGARSPVVMSALRMTPAGTVVPAEAGQHPADAVGGFLHRVGDPSPMLLGDGWFPAHGIFVAMARWVVDRVWELLDEPPERVAVAYPSGWGGGRLQQIHAALAEADLPGTALVTRARAVVESHQAAGRVPSTGGLLGVCRFGASTVEAAVVVPHGPGRVQLLGSAELTEAAGFEVDGLAPADARAVVQPGVDLAVQVVRRSGHDPSDLSAILIAGTGDAVYPYVSDLLSAAFPVPALRDPQPRMTVAAGAALAGRPQIRFPAPAVPPAALAAAESAEFAGLAESAGSPGFVASDEAAEPHPEIARDARAAADRPPRPPVHSVVVRSEHR